MEIRESDLNIASFFIANGLKLARLEGERHKVFIFLSENNQAEKLRVEYANNSPVAVRSFVSAQQNLKSLIYGDRK